MSLLNGSDAKNQGRANRLWELCGRYKIHFPLSLVLLSVNEERVSKLVSGSLGIIFGKERERDTALSLEILIS